MTPDRPTSRLSAAERINFLLTNRLPRRWLTLFMGRFSKIENPLIRWLSMSIWQLFADDLRLFEARKSRFNSMHACFTRALRDDARPICESEDILVSPCDAVIGQFGDVRGTEVVQAKGFPYTLDDLFAGSGYAESFRDGRFVTLRLKSSMYHRFHAPFAGSVDEATYISGDVWNVNPVALKVVERLFCKNERVVFPMTTNNGASIAMVAVAAILVASVRLRGLDVPLNLEYAGPNTVPLKRSFLKGEELGNFEHGSTIILFTQRGFDFVDSVRTGEVIRIGRPLMRRVDNL